MDKKTKYILIIAVAILIVLGIALAVYGSIKTKPMDTNTTDKNILNDPNAGLYNLINDMFSEEDNHPENVENTEKQESASNQTSAPTNITEGETKKDDKTTNAGQTTPSEKKAIELVKEQWKKEWGNLNDVSFNNESIQGDGKYVVSVNDSKTTKVVQRYVVDTVTGVVEEK